MDNVKHTELARSAYELYRLTGKMQTLMLDMFFEQFVEMDMEEQRRLIEEVHSMPP